MIYDPLHEGEMLVTIVQFAMEEQLKQPYQSFGGTIAILQLFRL